VDEVVGLQTPEDLLAVGFWYWDFSPTTLLKRSTAMSVTHERLVEAEAGVLFPGVLTIPENPRGIAAFARGSGSSRLSPATARSPSS
jgi:putative phosphoribosyl transferase